MFSKNLYYILISLLIIFLLVAGVFYLSRSLNGEFDRINSFEDCVQSGYSVMESYPRQCATPDGRTFVEDIGNEIEKLDLIQVSNPRPGQEIESSLLIEGQARGFWYFEASFPIRLLDGNGDDISLDPPYIMTSEEWMTEDFVPFSATINFQKPKTRTGTLILEKSNPSGLAEHDDHLIIPVLFKDYGDSDLEDTMEVKVFFGNLILANDPSSLDCQKVFPVTREIKATQAVARASMEELLKGPTASEASEGYITAIPEGSMLNSISISNGVAMVDFNSTTESGGGSCSMMMRVEQIQETLMQFSTVNSVELSIEGNKEIIFQP